MLIDDFDYELPKELIAQSPVQERDQSRLMVLPRGAGSIRHGIFSDLPEYLQAGDVMVINDAKVVPSRLIGTKATGGRIEALILRNIGGGRYEALVKGKTAPGTAIIFTPELQAAVEEDLGGGKKVIKFSMPESEGTEDAIREAASMPLPPYIDPSGRDAERDRERYQTVYAARPGAVAAPTAGLHFTENLLRKIKEKGVAVVSVTLQVGPGTFMPVREEVIERHKMEEEEYNVPEDTSYAVNCALAEGRRVIAVGTTSARTLESAFRDGRVWPGEGRTRLFIYPGYEFKAIRAMVTNFHLPKSTLLMLICAFAGRDKTLSAYREAVRTGYRFYSYGDAMLIT
ncbi:MAG: tRNA preQ1(34) S-adenosylmethionine ribosyltransferase-isomerase QueA [Nitrospirota bacterium]